MGPVPGNGPSSIYIFSFIHKDIEIFYFFYNFILSTEKKWTPSHSLNLEDPAIDILEYVFHFLDRYKIF